MAGAGEVSSPSTPEMDMSPVCESPRSRIRESPGKANFCGQSPEITMVVATIASLRSAIKVYQNELPELASPGLQNDDVEEAKRIVEGARKRATTIVEAANMEAEVLLKTLRTALEDNKKAVAERDALCVESAKQQHDGEIKKMNTSARERRQNALTAARNCAEKKHAVSNKDLSAQQIVGPSSPSKSTGACNIGSPRKYNSLGSPRKQRDSVMETVRLREDVRHYEQALQMELARQDDNISKAVSSMRDAKDSHHRRICNEYDIHVHTLEEELESMRQMEMDARQCDTVESPEKIQLQANLREELDASIEAHGQLKECLREQTIAVEEARNQLEQAHALNTELISGMCTIEDAEVTLNALGASAEEYTIEQQEAAWRRKLAEQATAHQQELRSMRARAEKECASRIAVAEKATRAKWQHVEEECAAQKHALAAAQATVTALRTKLRTQSGQTCVLENMLAETERTLKQREDAHAEKLRAAEWMRHEAQARSHAFEEEVVRLRAFEKEVVRTRAFEEELARTRAFEEEQVRTRALEEELARTRASEEELARTRAFEEELARTRASEEQERTRDFEEVGRSRDFDGVEESLLFFDEEECERQHERY